MHVSQALADVHVAHLTSQVLQVLSFFYLGFQKNNIKWTLVFLISKIIPVSRIALAFDSSGIKELLSWTIVALDLWVFIIRTFKALHGEIINNFTIRE